MAINLNLFDKLFEKFFLCDCQKFINLYKINGVWINEVYGTYTNKLYSILDGKKCGKFRWLKYGIVFHFFYMFDQQLFIFKRKKKEKPNFFLFHLHHYSSRNHSLSHKLGIYIYVLVFCGSMHTHLVAVDYICVRYSICCDQNVE